MSKTDQFLKYMIALAAVVMTLFHLLIVWKPMFGEVMNQNAHLGFCIVLLMLVSAHETSKMWKKAGYLLGLLLGIALIVYMALNYERLDMNAGFPEPLDVVVGICLLAFVIGGTWKAFGAVFPCMVLGFMIYVLWGHHIPGVLGHPPLDFDYIVSNLSVGFQGIYGMMLSASLNMLFLLIIFGALFEATGITPLFKEIGNFFGRYLPGGAGHTSIFSSSFVGMVNGSAPANVAITGAYTIPVMMKAGFRGELAGAIESMASTGGQLTPPIMGIAVFVMANFLGVSYGELIFKAIIPALFFYATAILGVILIAFREDIPKSSGVVDGRVIRSGLPVFLFPMTILTVILVLRYSVGFAAFYSIWALLAVAVLRRETRPSWKNLLECTKNGAHMASMMGLGCACIGVLIKSITFTGAATKFSMIISIISGGHLLPTLAMTAVLSIFLSASMPSVIAYIVVAFMAVPILANLGIRPVAAHFFVYYYAILAAVTPPIAGAAMVGCRISGADYMKTSWESFKLTGPFFLLPFFIVNNPIVFNERQAVFPAIMALLSMVMTLGSVMCMVQHYFLRPLKGFDYLLLGVVGSAGLCYGLYSTPAWFVIAAVLSLVEIAIQYRRHRSWNTETGDAVVAAGMVGP